MNRQRNQSPQLNGADTGEAPMTRDADLAEMPAQLNELLEHGEISPEAFAEYAATADAGLSSRMDSSGHTQIPKPTQAHFDHITLRVPDLALAAGAFKAIFDQLEIEQTTSTPSFSAWGNFALTQTDADHPIARRVHIAFIAPSRAHVDRFAQAGTHVGFSDDGPAGPRPHYADDYYAAFLKDAAGNTFEAVHRDDQRPRGTIDHVALRVNDVGASSAFYSTIGDAAGLTLRSQTPDRASFAVGASGASLSVVAGDPTQNIHIAFAGQDDDSRRFHADAIAAGYRSNGEPGERPRYHDGYYAAYVLDPDGNNIEVVNHHR